MTVLCAVVVAGIVWLLVPADSGARLRRILPTPAAGSARADRRRGLSWLASAVCGTAIALLMGGVLGVAAGTATAVVLGLTLVRLETRGDRAEREALDRAAPAFADLLAATLSAGVPVVVALEASADALEEPTSSALRPVVAAMRLGASPADAWAHGVAAHAPIAAAVVRSDETGAPLAELLSRMADDLRRQRRAQVEVAARSAGVRAVAPLAACFLPAFLLMGVVPVVASLASELLGT